jgi:hypothetical protein
MKAVTVAFDSKPPATTFDYKVDSVMAYYPLGLSARGDPRSTSRFGENARPIKH